MIAAGSEPVECQYCAARSTWREALGPGCPASRLGRHFWRPLESIRPRKAEDMHGAFVAPPGGLNNDR